jgi:hypothetical protein
VRKQKRVREEKTHDQNHTTSPKDSQNAQSASETPRKRGWRERHYERTTSSLVPGLQGGNSKPFFLWASDCKAQGKQTWWSHPARVKLQGGCPLIDAVLAKRGSKKKFPSIPTPVSIDLLTHISALIHSRWHALGV